MVDVAIDKTKLKYFMVVALEQIWLFRNRKWRGEPLQEGIEIGSLVNKETIKHWKAGEAWSQRKKLHQSKETLPDS